MLKRIFSVTNDKKTCHKVVTILGIKLKFKSIKLILNKINKQEEKLKNMKPVFKYIKWAKYQINKDIIDIQIEKFKKRGTIGINTTEEREHKIIVSLTTFPERIGDVHYAVFSLLNQTIKPDKVILWLGEEQFPDRENDVSQELLDLKNHGLTIEFTKDIKSFKKLVPALRQYPDDIIITADDDIYFPPEWLEKMYSEYLENPNRIYANLVYTAKLDNNGNMEPYSKFQKYVDDESSSLLNFAATGAGALFPPNSLYKDATNEELFKKLSPTSDENWFWAMAVMNKTETKVIKNPINRYAKVNVLRDCCFGNELTLARHNLEAQNKAVVLKDIYISNLLNYYPQMIELLKEANANKIIKE